MSRSYLPRLRDILEMIDDVAELIAGMDLDTYRADMRTRRAVERCIEIVSEASRHIPGAVPCGAVAGHRSHRQHSSP